MRVINVSVHFNGRLINRRLVNTSNLSFSHDHQTAKLSYVQTVYGNVS